MIDHLKVYTFFLPGFAASLSLALTLFLVLPVNVFSQKSETEARLESIFIEGNQNRLLGHYDKAQEAYEEVLKLDPSNDVAAFELGRVLAMLDRDGEAIKSVKKAIELDPENTWYQLYLGDLYQKTGQFPDAANLFQTLAMAHPENEEYLLKQAFFLVKANEPAEAIKVYNQLERKMGINEELTRRKHALYMGMGDTEKAARELEFLVAAFPSNLQYRHLLASFFETVGDTKRAKKVYTEILGLDANDPAAKLYLAGSQNPEGKELAFLNSLVPIFENAEVGIDLKIKELIPFVQKVADQQDYELANRLLTLVEILKKLHPDEAKVYALAGDLYFHTNRPEEALSHYQRTVELDETVYLVWEQLLQTLKSLERFENLVRQSENALDIFPNQASLYYYNGLGWSHLKKYEKAFSALNQAEMMAGQNAGLQYQISTAVGWTHFQKGDFEKAANILKAAVEKSNESEPTGLEFYGDALFKLGRVDDAVLYWQKAMERGGKSSELTRKIQEKRMPE